MSKVAGTNSAWDSETNKYLNTHRATGMYEKYDDQMNPSTLPITTTNINVYCNNMRIGFVQSFAPSEQRTINKIQELGTEGVVQSVPGNTNGGQIAMTRFAVYNGMLFNALGMTPTGKFSLADEQIYLAANTNNNNSRTYGNPFKTLKDQRVPLELQTKTIMPDTVNKFYVETYVDCWVSNYSRTTQSSQITITESATLQYSDVIASIATADDGK